MGTMSAVLTQTQTQDLKGIKAQLLQSLDDYWDSQVFLGDTRALKRLTGDLNRFFKREAERSRKRRD